MKSKRLREQMSIFGKDGYNCFDIAFYRLMEKLRYVKSYFGGRIEIYETSKDNDKIYLNSRYGKFSDKV